MILIDADELRKAKFHPLPYTHIVPNGENAQSYERGWNDAIDAIIENAPTVDAVPAVRCKDCKYFELNHIEHIDGIPLILAHQICTRWGDGCKTDDEGYCFMGERREVQRNFNASNTLDALGKEC